MKVNPISFTRTIKVYAPHHDAVRIANAANGAPCVSAEVQKQVQDIFNDTNKGHALAYTRYDDSGIDYIFSGDESREYLNNLFKKTSAIKKIKRDYCVNEALFKVLKEKEEFENKISELIKRTQVDYALKISPNGEKIEIVE